MKTTIIYLTAILGSVIGAFISFVYLMLYAMGSGAAEYMETVPFYDSYIMEILVLTVFINITSVFVLKIKPVIAGSLLIISSLAGMFIMGFIYFLPAIVLISIGAIVIKKNKTEK